MKCPSPNNSVCACSLQCDATFDACEAARPRPTADTRMAARRSRASRDRTCRDRTRIRRTVSAGSCGRSRRQRTSRASAANRCRAHPPRLAARAICRDQRGSPARCIAFAVRLGSGAAIARRVSVGAPSVKRAPPCRSPCGSPPTPRPGVAGMSMRSMPSGLSASITALMTTGRRADRAGLADALDADRIGLAGHFFAARSRNAAACRRAA